MNLPEIDNISQTEIIEFMAKYRIRYGQQELSDDSNYLIVKEQNRLDSIMILNQAKMMAIQELVDAGAPKQQYNNIIQQYESAFILARHQLHLIESCLEIVFK
jgi:hypothetical protein